MPALVVLITLLNPSLLWYCLADIYSTVNILIESRHDYIRFIDVHPALAYNPCPRGSAGIGRQA